eukprot:RCo044853
MDCKLLFERKAVQRNELIAELVREEDTYNRRMLFLQDRYLTPLQQHVKLPAAQGGLSAADYHRLFRNIDDLAAVSTCLCLRFSEELRKLELAQDPAGGCGGSPTFKPTSSKFDRSSLEVGEILCTVVSPHLRVFEAYALRYPAEVQPCLSRLLVENPELRKFLSGVAGGSPAQP